MRDHGGKKMTHLSRESMFQKGANIWWRLGDSNGHLYTSSICGCMKNIIALLLKEWVDPRIVKSPPPAHRILLPHSRTLIVGRMYDGTLYGDLFQPTTR